MDIAALSMVMSESKAQAADGRILEWALMAEEIAICDYAAQT